MQEEVSSSAVVFGAAIARGVVYRSDGGIDLIDANPTITIGSAPMGDGEVDTIDLKAVIWIMSVQRSVEAEPAPELFRFECVTTGRDLIDVLARKRIDQLPARRLTRFVVDLQTTKVRAAHVDATGSIGVVLRQQMAGAFKPVRYFLLPVRVV